MVKSMILRCITDCAYKIFMLYNTTKCCVMREFHIEYQKVVYTVFMLIAGAMFITGIYFRMQNAELEKQSKSAAVIT